MCGVMCNLHKRKLCHLHSVRMSPGRACSNQIVEAIGFGSHTVIEIIWLKLLLLWGIMLHLPHFPNDDVRCAYKWGLVPSNCFQVKLCLLPWIHNWKHQWFMSWFRGASDAFIWEQPHLSAGRGKQLGGDGFSCLIFICSYKSVSTLC